MSDGQLLVVLFMALLVWVGILVMSLIVWVIVYSRMIETPYDDKAR